MRNIWFIGDIHGEVGLLERLLENILRFGPDQLVFVGDYIDRGPYSREVVDRIMNLSIPFTCLMGNHELMMLNAMEDHGYGHSPIELWYYNGGEATLHSFGSTSFFNFQSNMAPKYLDFFRKLKMCHVVDMGGMRLFGTHAGISPAIPLEDQMAIGDYRALNQYLQEKHLEPGDSFLWIRDSFFDSRPSLWEGFLVVHGHTPVAKLKRFISSNGYREFYFVDNDICIRKDHQSGNTISIDIDSGSVISGRLTAVGFFLEDDQDTVVRLRSMTVSREEIFPRDLGYL